MPKQTLLVRESLFTIHSLDPDSDIPASVLASPLFFLGKTEEELSIVVPNTINVSSIDCDEGWRAMEQEFLWVWAVFASFLVQKIYRILLVTLNILT